MLSPLTFEPRFKERLWGGRRLQSVYHKALPSNLPIGESWEITDRPGDVSVIASGPLAGRDLHWLIENHAVELLGAVPLLKGRFPLLLKILDAEETLSLQVHPSEQIASQLHGEPKTEMWFLTETAPRAELFAGLRRGFDRISFEERLRIGTVADCIHRLPVRSGDALFVPSGRVHAIGAGCLLFEVQQNSDTTYRVFDWNRIDREGKPRALQVEASMQSIDFADVEPDLIRSSFSDTHFGQVRPLVDCPWFAVEQRRLRAGADCTFERAARILAVSQGELQILHPSNPLLLAPGNFCLLPACLDQVTVSAKSAADFLVIQPK